MPHWASLNGGSSWDPEVEKQLERTAEVASVSKTEFSRDAIRRKADRGPGRSLEPRLADVVKSDGDAASFSLPVSARRNTADDPWVTVDTRRAQWQQGAYGSVYYQANFPVVAGDKQCKARARFTAANHDPSKKTDRFSC